MKNPAPQEAALAPIIVGKEIFFPVHLDAIRIESRPDFALYFRSAPNEPLVLYCDEGVVFTADARIRLQENQVKQLYIRQNQRSAYTRYVADHLDALLKDPRVSTSRKASVLYDSAQQSIETVMEEPEEPEHIALSKEVMRHTVELMRSKSFLLEQLLRTISSDYYVYTHSVNVVAYSIMLARFSGFQDAPTLREVANGALLHDVGKSLIGETIAKEDHLSEAEWELVREYPRNGHALLSASQLLGEIALDIVLHHQERFDGSGYPDGLAGAEVSRFARMVAVADVFDALTTDRPHQQGKSTFEALRLMHQEMDQRLDPDLLAAFTKMMSGQPHG